MKFAHIDTNTGTIIKKLREHPRADGGPVVGLTPGTAIVPIETPDLPAGYDSRTHAANRVETVTPTAVVMEWNIEARPVEEVNQTVDDLAQQHMDSVVSPFQQRRLTMKPAVLTGGGAGQAKQKLKELSDWMDAVEAEAESKKTAIAAGQPVDLDQWPEFTP